MTSECRSHVAPEPIEAPEPQPVRRRDLVRAEALRLGWRALCAEGEALSTFTAFLAGVEAYEEHLRRHDYRRPR